MKTIPIITFFLCTVMYAHAQLNIVPKNDGLKEYTVTNAHPYDSLTNVEKRSFTSLPGQTLYMHGVKNDRNGYWDAFPRFSVTYSILCSTAWKRFSTSTILSIGTPKLTDIPTAAMTFS